MKLSNTTAVPNQFFDNQMKDLSGSALRVYLKIVRNTIGWRDNNGNIKKRDWIAHSQFEKVFNALRNIFDGYHVRLKRRALRKKLIRIKNKAINAFTS